MLRQPIYSPVKLLLLWKNKLKLQKVIKRIIHFLILLFNYIDSVFTSFSPFFLGVKHEIFSHWHPNITINLVNDYTPWIPGQVPPPLDEFVEFTPSFQNYKPILYMNDYWNLNKEFQPINETVKVLNLTMTYQPLSMFKWQMYR